jgi:hypothetical protein
MTTCMQCVAEDARATLESVHRHGWVQGTYWSRRGGCLVGHATYITTGAAPYGTSIADADTWHRSRFYALYDALSETIGGVPERWNDAPSRSYEDVVRVLECVIRRYSPAPPAVKEPAAPVPGLRELLRHPVAVVAHIRLRRRVRQGTAHDYHLPA